MSHGHATAQGLLLEAIARHGLPAVIFACCHRFNPVGYEDALQQLVRVRAGSDNIRGRIMYWYDNVYRKRLNASGQLRAKRPVLRAQNAERGSKPLHNKQRGQKRAAEARLEAQMQRRAEGSKRTVTRRAIDAHLRDGGAKDGFKRTVVLKPGDLPACSSKLRERAFMCRGESTNLVKERWVDTNGNAVG